MFKLVILNNDIESLKIICNNIINEIPEIQLSGICTNIKEFDNLVNKVKADIILMNYSDYRNSVFRKKSDFPKFKIIFCTSKILYKSSSNKLFISQTNNHSEILKLIKDFISTANIDALRLDIIKQLEKDFHFDFKLIGTTYLLESILYCYEKKTEYVFENLEKNVYPYIAKKFNTTPLNVKGAIVRCIDLMNVNVSISNNYISNNTSINLYEKPTAKQIINSIVTKLN